MYVTSLVYISMPLILKINIVITTQRACPILEYYNDQFVAESIDEGGFRSDTLFSGHLNPIIGESPICLGEFVKEFGQFKQEMMDLESKVYIMAAEGMQWYCQLLWERSGRSDC